MINSIITPADILGESIAATKLANDNIHNTELYEVLMYRACVLKHKHSKMVGPAAEKIILQNYGSWINDKHLAAKSLKYAILEKHGIDTNIVVTEEGVTINIRTFHSTCTLIKTFKKYSPLIKSVTGLYHVMFLEFKENITISEVSI